MQCIRCGKEMVNTTGGNYHCPSCGHAVDDLVYRPSNCDIPMPNDFGEWKGWICPVCGRGVAPWTSFCPCQSDWKITYGTSTNNGEEFNHVTPELEKIFKLNDERVSEMISFYEEHKK